MTSPRPLSSSPTGTAPPAGHPAGARASRGALLEAHRLGAAVARADLAGRPDDAAPVYASWRRLRRRTDRQSRQLLRVAFDTGYGQAWAVPR